MSTMDELVTKLSRRLRDSQINQYIIDAINSAIQDVLTYHNWSWAQTGVGSVRTIAPSSFTAVTVTSGSATVTLTSSDAGIAQASTDIGLGIFPFITFGSNDRFYRLTAITVATPNVLTITPTFIGTSSATETAELYFREYALPSDLIGIREVVGEDGEPLDAVTIPELWYMNGRPTQSPAEPTGYALRTGTRQKILMDPLPDAAYAIAFEYQASVGDLAAGATEAALVVPRQWHKVLEAGAMSFLLRDVKNDSRWEAHEGRFQNFLAEMVIEDQTANGQRLPVIQTISSKRGLQRQRAANRWGETR